MGAYQRRGWKWGVREMGEGGEKYTLSVIKVVLGCNVQHGDYSRQYSTVYSKEKK